MNPMMKKIKQNTASIKALKASTQDHGGGYPMLVLPSFIYLNIALGK
jgi:hypothetical protein